MKVHRVLESNQSPWLKQYIDFNTDKRKHAKNPFEKDFFKFMNNSVFDKTMENLRKRVDVRLVTNEKKLLKLTSKPTYVSSKIFNENLVAVHKIKEALILNRPAYVGMCILDLSKTLKNKVEEIQQTNLVSLGSLASKNGFVKQIWPLPDCTATRSYF